MSLELLLVAPTLDGECRDALDATMNYSAHQKFVDKWFQKLEGESAAATS
jgi:hypothetical protein